MSHAERVPYSCGIIPLQQIQQQWQVLLVQHRYGQHWGFPKGHQEVGETPWDTAERELVEETGLYIVKRLSKDPLREQYFMATQAVTKTVDYFVALVGGNVAIQESEIKVCLWLPIEQAMTYLSFPQARSLLAQAATLVQ